LAIDPKNNIKLAVKIIDSTVFKQIQKFENFNDIPKSHQVKLKYIQEEIKILKALSHENIITFYD